MRARLRKMFARFPVMACCLVVLPLLQGCGQSERETEIVPTAAAPSVDPDLAVRARAIFGELPAEVAAEVTRLWKECLEILSDVIARGVESGAFRACDPWSVAHVLWTSANGLIRGDHVDSEGRLRARPLEPVFTEMVEIFLRGLAP